MVPMAVAAKNPTRTATTLTTPMAPAPKLFSSQIPEGASAANAPYEAMPVQEITWLPGGGPTFSKTENQSA